MFVVCTLAACRGGADGEPQTQPRVDAGEQSSLTGETSVPTEDAGGRSETRRVEVSDGQTASSNASSTASENGNAGGDRSDWSDSGSGDTTSVLTSAEKGGSWSETRITSGTPSRESATTNATDDASALPHPPDVSPIAALVQSLLPGPPEVTCNTQNPCEAGNCVFDTNPCDGSFTVEVATDLDLLAGCTSVSGDLSISAPELTTLSALQSLVTVGGNLTITGSDALTNLGGLDALMSVAGDVTIGALDEGNATLVDLGGLEQLGFVGGVVRVASNPALQTLAGFELEEHQNWLILQSNAGLLDIENLASLTCLGMFTLHDSPLVTHLGGLENLEQLGRLRLSFSPVLNNLDALQELQWIPGMVELYGLDSLSSLRGLGGLVGVGSLLVNECPQLQSYSGLDSLTVVRDDLWCYFDSFAGLGHLRAVGGDLNLERNGGTVEGLDAIEMVRYLSLNGDIDLGGLRPGTLFGGMNISFNATIDDLRALENVHVSEGLYLTANTNLRTLDGFRHTDEFLLGLGLFNNPALTDLSALGGVRAFYDQIVIWGNESLVDFTGLDSVEHIGNRLIIRDTAPFTNDGSVGLESLKTFDGWLIVDTGFDVRWIPQLESTGTLSFQSDSLTDLTAFSRILVKRGLWVNQNQNLLSLDGLSHDGVLEDEVHLDQTPLLTNLDALRGVTFIGELYISANAALTNLEGLNDLESIGSRLTIADNARLENLDGLVGLTSIVNEPQTESAVVSITDNSSLPQCAAAGLVARLDPARGVASGNDEAGICE